MFFSNNFISRKTVFLWLILISTTVLSTELVQRSSKAEREKVALNVVYPFDQVRIYKAAELRGAVNIKHEMNKPLEKGL